MYNIQISRDTEGVRIELFDPADAAELKKLGPFSLDLDKDKFVCRPNSSGHNVCYFEDDVKQIRQGVGIRFYTTYGGVSQGRFGPVKLEVDIHCPTGFGSDLPPMHQRKWPKLRDNKTYDIGEQILQTLAERIWSRAMFVGTSIQKATQIESRKIPGILRRHLPSQVHAESTLKTKLASLHLRDATA